MKLETIIVGQLETNCYIISEDQGTAAAIIDPGDDSVKILAAVSALGLSVEKLLLTHGHWDHVGALSEIAAETGAEIMIHEEDREMLANPEKNLSVVTLFERRSAEADQGLIDGQSISVGGLEVKVIHTPGHTPGSVSFLAENHLFDGDLLFYGSIGRTDFPGGSQEQLHHSVHGKVMTLPDETIIHPGHGPQTSVERERAENP